ncbi:MAG: hypothetical protein FWE40_03045 [Oscillospiraceae bacterium]|nr:hypothetical protein [Oscillospiraceae bacterium]
MNYSLFAGILSTLFGALGLLITLLNFKRNQVATVNAWYATFRAPEFVKARRVVRDLDPNYDPRALNAPEKDDIAFLIIAYMEAGMLLRRRQLPFRIFERHHGHMVISFYEKLLPYIAIRRTDGEKNPDYADEFEYLYQRIKRKKK